MLHGDRARCGAHGIPQVPPTRTSANRKLRFSGTKGIVFEGEHWAYSRIEGDQVFGNLTAPGWARAGSFKDPREFSYGPLPRDWAHWKGLYQTSVWLLRNMGRNGLRALQWGRTLMVHLLGLTHS